MVTASTVEVIRRELLTARDTVLACLSAGSPRQKGLVRSASSSQLMATSPKATWEQLFVSLSEPVVASDLSLAYLFVDLTGDDAETINAWAAFAEAQMRRLCLDLALQLWYGAPVFIPRRFVGLLLLDVCLCVRPQS